MFKRILSFLVLAAALLLPASGRLCAQEPAATPLPRAGSATHLLNLALLVAGNKPADAGEALPAAVAKAVADVKDFLPFKNYRMLDSALVRTADSEPVSVELQGPDLSRYRANFRYQISGNGNRLNFIRFEVILVADSYGRGPATPVPPRPDSSPDPGRRREAPTPAASREVISTGFSIDVGETIVVGTSRLRGDDRALMVVVTAASGK